jgi:hypothetical protein
MASAGKRKTTMAKLARESRLRERRQDKQAKKDARKVASAEGLDGPGEVSLPALDGSALAPGCQPLMVDVPQSPADPSDS